MDRALIPPASARFVAQTDGWMAWLSVPHAITRTSFLVEASGSVEVAIQLWQGSTQQAWRCTLRGGDAASLSTVPLERSLVDPQLARDGEGAAWLFGREPTLRGACFRPLDDPGAVRHVTLAAGVVSLALLPSAKLACQFINPKTFSTVRVVIGDGDGEATTLEMPRGFTLGDLLEIEGGYLLVGKLKEQTVVLRFDAQGRKLPSMLCTPPAAVRIHAVLGVREDGALVALGSKGNAIGEVSLEPERSGEFVPWLTLPVEESAVVQMQALNRGEQRPRSAMLSYQSAGGARSGWAALRFADGRVASWLLTRSDHPGAIDRPWGSEQLDETQLLLIGYDELDGLEAALFQREPPSGGTSGTRYIARVWR